LQPPDRLPSLLEEIPQQRCAFAVQHAADHLYWLA
jgi:hypothetical protein